MIALILTLLLGLNQKAMAQDALAKGVQREIQFLTAQKASLLGMKQEINRSTLRRRDEALRELKVLREELIKVSKAVQEEQGQLALAEKSGREGVAAKGQLEKISFKIHEATADITKRMGLGDDFVPAPRSNGPEAAEFVKVQLSKTLELLGHLSTPAWRKHAFMDEEDRIVEGDVLFYGPFAAHGMREGKEIILAPYDKHWFKSMGPSSHEDALSTLYIFDPVASDQGKIKAARSWREGVADSVPAVVMVAIMLAVLILFIGLARA